MDFLANNWFLVLLTVSVVIFLFTKADKTQVDNIINTFLELIKGKNKEKK